MRRSSVRSRPAPPNRSLPVNRKALIAGGSAVVIALVLLFWPRPEVTNLDSRGTTIITFGDSLTAGVGATAGEDYPSRLAQKTKVEILNAGVSGDTTAAAWVRIET